MEIAVTLISCIWNNYQLSLNTKDGGDVFVCSQLHFKWTTRCKDFAERSRIPLHRPLPSLSLLPGKCQENLKLITTN
jgi:hypothetical protein